MPLFETKRKPSEYFGIVGFKLLAKILSGSEKMYFEGICYENIFSDRWKARPADRDCMSEPFDKLEALLKGRQIERKTGVQLDNLLKRNKGVIGQEGSRMTGFRVQNVSFNDVHPK